MRPFDDMDELHGDPGLRAFVDDVRAFASGPPPVVRGDLAAILTGGIGSAPAGGPAVARPGPVVGPLRRLGDRLQGRRGRLALGASVLSLTVLGTGGAGALPGPAQAAFERTVEAVGIELPEEVRQSDPQGTEDRAPRDPAPEAPVGTGDGERPELPQPPPPQDDRRPDAPPVPDDPISPATPGTTPPEARDGAGAPGDGLRREPGGDRPASPPTTPAPPVSPPRPGSPGVAPGAPPDGVPAGSPEEDEGELRGGPAQQGTRGEPVTDLRGSPPPGL